MPYKCGKCAVYAKLTRAGACYNELCARLQVRCLLLMDAAGEDPEQEDGPFDMTTIRWRRRGPPPSAKHLQHRPSVHQAREQLARRREQLAREQRACAACQGKHKAHTCGRARGGLRTRIPTLSLPLHFPNPNPNPDPNPTPTPSPPPGLPRAT